MSGRIVSAEEARKYDDDFADERAYDLAHTVVVQAEQIAAVLALHRPSQEGHRWGEHPKGFDAFCVGCWEAGGYDGATTYPCPTARAVGVTG